MDWSDEELVFEIVSKSGWVLKFVSPELKNNKKIVLSAVKNYGSALLYASEELKKDKEIALSAISNCPSSFLYVSNELKNKRSLYSSILKRICNEFELCYIMIPKMFDFKFTSKIEIKDFCSIIKFL